MDPYIPSRDYNREKEESLKNNRSKSLKEKVKSDVIFLKNHKMTSNQKSLNHNPLQYWYFQLNHVR